MQVLLKKASIPGTVRNVKTGEKLTGSVHFEVQLYSEGERRNPWDGSVAPATAAEWLRQEIGGSVVVPPPPPLLDVPAVEVPAAVLRALPSNARVVMEWEWRKTH